MPDGGTPPPLDSGRPASPEELEGAYLWFDGLLEGPAGDREMMRGCVTGLNAVGPVMSNLEVDGGRFSLLLDDRSKRMSGISNKQRERVMQLFQEIVDVSSDPLRCESTLRCTEIVGGHAHETLFAVSAGTVQKVSRSRPVNSDDERRRPRQSSIMGSRFGDSRRRKPLVVGVILLLCVLAVSLQFGLVGRLFSPPVEEVAIQKELFGAIFETSLEKELGNYLVTISRGEDYPLTMSEFDSRIRAAERMEVAAMLGVVARGETLYVRLIDEDEQVAFERGISLKPLLLDREKKLTVLMPGIMNASAVRLALSPSSVQK